MIHLACLFDIIVVKGIVYDRIPNNTTKGKKNIGKILLKLYICLKRGVIMWNLSLKINLR